MQTLALVLYVFYIKLQTKSFKLILFKDNLRIEKIKLSFIKKNALNLITKTFTVNNALEP